MGRLFVAASALPHEILESILREDAKREKTTRLDTGRARRFN